MDFIQNERLLKHTDPNIQQSLESAGWKTADIVSTFDHIDKDLRTDQKPADSRLHKNKTAIVLTFLFFILVGAGYLSYSWLTKAPQLNSKETLLTTNATTNPIIAYVESHPDDYAGNVVFYDTQKKAKLPPDPLLSQEADSLFQLGIWSPHGQYLPILQIVNPGSDNSIINLYLFDSQKKEVKRIHSAPRGDENFVWASTSFSFTSGWMDDSRLVVRDDRGTSQGVTTLTYFTPDGELKTVEPPDVFKRVSNQLTSTTILDVDTKQETIVVGSQTLSFAPEGTIVGVIDDRLVVVKKPVSSTFFGMDFEGGTSSSQEWTDFEAELKELEKQGMSQEELSLRVRDFLEPKGETVINFYNIDTGAIENALSLTDGTWQTVDVLVHPSEKTMVAHQTDKEFLPTKERFIKIQMGENPTIETLFENNLTPEHNHNFSGRLLLQGNSFLLSGDGNWIIGERGSITDDPQHSAVFMHNISTGEEIIVCSEYCSDIRTYYPLALQRRY